MFLFPFPRIIYVLLLGYFGLDFSVNASIIEKKKIPVTQSQLSGFILQMENPNFWLAKLSNSQELIWTKERIDSYNRENIKKGRILNPFGMGTSINASSVRRFIDQDLNFLRRYIKYDREGRRRRDPEFNDYLKSLVDYNALKGKKSLTIKYGLVVNKNAELRYIPTELQIYRNLDDLKVREFEILKKTYLDAFAPVAIIWKSADSKWYFVETSLSRGWVKKDYLITGSMSKMRDFFMGELSGVVISPLATVYRGKKNFKAVYSPLALPMGSEVYYRSYDPVNKFTEIIIPNKSSDKKLFKDSYYIKTKDLSPDFLTFNYQNLVNQALKFLNTGYSWGGDYDRTDCSLFLYRLYRTFGIKFPRSSIQQIVSLKPKKISLVGYSQFSTTLLPLKTIAHINGPNHILLYLGKHQNKDYFIHSTWSYNDSSENEYLIKSVVVSDLTLGMGSKLGSLEERISKLGFF